MTGRPGPHIRQVWLVCHGYAQLADEFIHNFDILDPEETLVVAPEGLNHAYRKGFSGDVVANWMTRHYREFEIADNAAYLQALYDLIIPQVAPEARIVLLGFSQGAATVCRWIMRDRPHFHDLLLWAGLPPEDIDYAAEKAYLADKNLYLLYGSTDPFLTEESMQRLQQIENQNGIDFNEHAFDGGHEIPGEALKAIVERIRQ